MKFLGLVLSLVPVVSFAQYPYAGYPTSANQAAVEQQAKSGGCNAIANLALSQFGGYYPSGNSPIALIDGKTNVIDQDRIISKKTAGDVETIEYKIKEVIDYKDQKPVYDMVRKTLVIKRNGGKVVSISHPQDLKRAAAIRAASDKRSGTKADYKLIKSYETTFKAREDGGCQTDQKEYVAVKDENGNEKETVVSYDADFCQKLQPMIAKMGSNNAAECGPFFASAEKIFSDRAAGLKSEGKSLMPGIVPKDTGKSVPGNLGVSIAIAQCVQEAQVSAGVGIGMGYVGGQYAGPLTGTGGTYPSANQPAQKAPAKAEAATQ